MKSVLFVLTFINLILGFSQTGPGGVGTNDGTSTLEYWIDASNSVSGTSPITGWTDLSGNTITNTISGNPVLTTNSLNGYDVITFDGTGDFVSTNLNISGNTFPQCDIYAVYTMTGTKSAVWGEDNGGYDRFLVDVDGAGGCTGSVTTGTGCLNNANLFPAATSVITSIQFSEDVANGSSAIVNGTNVVTFSSNHENETSNNFDVGSIGNSNHLMNGNIAEVFVFSESLNLAQQIILHNYLSAKYNIALTSNDFYNEDDVAANYDHDVAGIGQASDGSNHTDAQGSGLVRILSPNNLANNEYLIWGHDNGDLSAANVTDLPATIQSRLARDWSVSETGEVGTVTIRVDLSDVEGMITSSDLRLLIDADGVYNSGTTISGAPTDLGSDIYEWTGINIDDNEHFTVGSINQSQTPLPIELINFQAKVIKNEVLLEWQTMSERNNDYFTIQYSTNNILWKEVVIVDGAGNSNNLLSYSIIDNKPFIGISYYRLKQTDFDGNFSFSSIKNVNVQKWNNKVEIYSNSSHKLIIKGSLEELKEISIYNLLGQDVTILTQQLEKSDNKVIIDLSQLNTGVYYVKTKSVVNKVYK